MSLVGDLYYRLRVVEVTLPALRDRGRADLDRLADHFVRRCNERHGRTACLSEAARAKLHAHPWPGNVRELENCIESAVVLGGGVIEPPDLQLATRLTGPLPSLTGPGAFSHPGGTFDEVERSYVRHVLDACGGNRSEAARQLGISRNRLARKLEG